MLWYKSWLETRLRFLVGVGAMAALCAFCVFYHPTAVARLNEMLRLHPDWPRPWWIYRALNEYSFFIWRILYDTYLHFLWAIFAVLIGVGGLTQESVKGQAQFTLSLPLERQLLSWTHGVVCCMELFALGLISAGIRQKPLYVMQKILIFCSFHPVSTRSFKKPPGARPIEVSFKPGGSGSPAAAGEVR